MAAKAASGWLYNAFSITYKNTYIRHNVLPGIFIQIQNYAARKSTREKALRLKNRRVAMKEAQNAAILKMKEKIQEKKMRKSTPLNKMLKNDSWKSDPVDDVWVGKYHRWKIYSFEEAVECHREMHHPTILNSPNSQIKAYIELNLDNLKKVKAKNKSLLLPLIRLPHKFEHGQQNSILAFCMDKDQEESLNAGALTVGGKSLIKDIQNGDVSIKDYEYVIAHINMLSDILVLKGLLRKKFPIPTNDTLTNDVPKSVAMFKRCIKYDITLHPSQKSLGTIDVAFGTLDMDTQQLEENLTCVLKTVDTTKESHDTPFITRVRLLCLPSVEKFKIDFEKYLSKAPKETVKTEDTKEQEEEEMNEEAVIPSH